MYSSNLSHSAGDCPFSKEEDPTDDTEIPKPIMNDPTNTKTMCRRRIVEEERSFFVLRIQFHSTSPFPSKHRPYSLEPISLKPTKRNRRRSVIDWATWDTSKLVEWLSVYDSRPYIARLNSLDKSAGEMAMMSPSCNTQDYEIAYCPRIFCMDGYCLSKTTQLLKYFSNPFLYNELTFFTPVFGLRCDAVVPTSSGFDASKRSILFTSVISLKPPTSHVMDAMGSRLANTYLNEKHDVDCALSWLSTLGGAYSCLGETSKSWALSAGEISLKQLKLAIRLDDPLITARCKIYMSLSLIQRGYLHAARRIVENQYAFYLSLPSEMDTRLGKMCQGVWHKLKYEWNMRIERTRLRHI